MKPHLHIAIPAMDELSFLPQTLNDIRLQQTEYRFSVYICVNQPDNWWDNPEKLPICENNAQLMAWLHQQTDLPIMVIDRSSRGAGWVKNDHGVGWARKVLFDAIIAHENTQPHDVIISLDADTRFNEDYFQTICSRFHHTKCQVISVPYYHQLTNNDAANQAILRYEVYMRNYLIALYNINSPYNFTAVGSAIAMRVEALKKIGGITPMKSGEDFYLLQKMRKMTLVENWNDACVYPAARFSDRVFFGTGPAMIKGAEGNWTSYPIYHYSLFKIIEETYQKIEYLFDNEWDNEFTLFLKKIYKVDDLWSPLRKNNNSIQNFTKAFHQKADGLRILQFLKEKQEEKGYTDQESLHYNATIFQLNGALPEKEMLHYSTQDWQVVRNLFFEKEMTLRQLHG